VVYEFVGKSTFDATLASVKDGGVIVSIGAASGAPAFNKEAAAKRGLKMVGGPMAPYLAGQVSQAANDVFDAFRAGVLGDVPFTEYALRDASEAHAAIAARTKTGALVLVP
jgi:NADPH2:quinone reductase